MATALTAPKVKTLKTPGTYRDGEVKGLYLLVRLTDSGALTKSWIFRYMKSGKAHAMGLGAAADITLADVRKEADALRKALKAGRDPIVEKRVAALKGSPKTFDDCAAEYIEAQSPAWRGIAYRLQFERMLRNHVPGHFGKLPISEITEDMVREVLNKIWNDKKATARMLQNRIERVLGYAIKRKYRSGPNPADYKDNIKGVLADHSTDTRHHAAMSYDDIPGFMTKLKAEISTASYALQFLILTAVRSNEACGATWDEIDLKSRTWTIPARRMKTGKAGEEDKSHQVPLSTQAVEIITAMQSVRRSNLVFPGAHGGQMPGVTLARVLKKHAPDATVHGFRSAFRDWCGEETTAPRELAEHALAHRMGDATEQAYRRRTALEKRRVLMQAWAAWCDGARGGQSNIVELRA
jgi:integrase